MKVSGDKGMLKEMIVVEGKNDTLAVRRAVKAETIETGGSFLTKAVLDRIKRAQEVRGVIILTDPDYAGEMIRKKISRLIPGVKHAFISREEGMSAGDVGVENASPEAIRNALSFARVEQAEGKAPISWAKFVDLGLVGEKNAAILRDRLGRRLGIGYGNAKQFYERLRMLAVPEEEFFQAYREVYGGGKPNE